MVAFAALAAAAGYPLLDVDRLKIPLSVLAGVGLALLLLGLVGLRQAVGVAVATVGIEYVSWLALGSRPLDAASPLVAAGLVLCTELSYRSLDASGPVPPARGESVRRAVTAIAIAAAGGSIGLVLLGVADAAPVNSRLLQALAVAAAVGIFAAVTTLASKAAPLDSSRDRGSSR